MNYGEQKFMEYSRELTPEEKARQTLLLEAIREQAAYEKELNKKIVEKVKYTATAIYRVLIFTLLSLIAATLIITT